MKWIALALAIGLLAPAVAGAQEDYDPEKAGHPLRIVAYLLHPVGWLLDRVIFFPAWWIGGHEPLRSIVGHDGLPERRDEVVLPADSADEVPAEHSEAGEPEDRD